ncbi:MAG: IS5 family transposase [Thermodesulfobacteriota bacterium]
MQQTGFFDWQRRFEQLDEGGDPLVKLNKVVSWEIFRPDLETLREKERKSSAGRKPFDVVLMFKILVLQSLYNLSDDQTEYQVRDCLSFMRFLGLAPGDAVPDAQTVWLFREELTTAGLVEKIFNRFDVLLRDSGFAAKKGQIVDASIVRAPQQRNNRDENKQIKAGEIPEEWSSNKKRQKDTDARWLKKNGQNHYGYKNHVSIDVKHKLIRSYDVTPASTHDSKVFESLLDEANSSRDVWADSAYRSDEKLDELKRRGFRAHLQRKGCRHKKLTKREKKGNYSRSKIRSRVEHVFGVQAKRAGNLLIRTVGLVRAEAKIGLRNLAYNLDRYRFLMQT